MSTPSADRASIDILGKLAARGILDAATAAGWETFTVTQTGVPMTGWRYPVYGANGAPHKGKDGKQVWRWKNADGGKPKYLWLWSKPDAAKYYLLPDTLRAIGETGTLYLAAGEPDTLVYRTLGIHNASCLLTSEGALPDTFLENLRFMGVQRVVYAPDLDNAGYRAAWKIARALHGSGIALEVLRLPGEMGSKFDLNAYWQALAFDVDEFARQFADLPTIEPDELALYGDAPKAANLRGLPAADALRADWYKEWIAAIVASLGEPVAKEGRVYRWRCPTGRHGAGGDAHPSFRVASERNPDLPWPMCSCGIQDEDDAWGIVAAALGADSWEQFKARKTAQGKPPDKPTPPRGSAPIAPPPEYCDYDPGLEPEEDGDPADDETLFFVDNHEVVRKICADLRGECELPADAPIPFPFKPLHRFGGFAELMFPGKLVFVLGVSGGGKTSFGETCAENLARVGTDVLWWGPEWSPYESGLRALQRGGGPTMLDKAAFDLWRVDERSGVPPAKRRGAPLGDAVREGALARLHEIENWPGRIYYVDPKAKLSLEDLFAGLRALVKVKRAAGRKVGVVFFDYMQLARKFASSSNAFWAEDVSAQIKAICIELALVGFVFTQPRKDDSAKTRNGDTLTEAAGQSLSDQQCNLYLTLTPHFDLAGKMTSYATIKAVKNSMGRTGEIQVQTDLARLRWLEAEVQTTSQSVISTVAAREDAAR